MPPPLSHMLTDQDRITRGLQAEALMREPAFNELFEAVTAEMSAAILNTAISQTEHRQEYYLTYHGMRSFAQTLNRYVIEKDGIIQQMNEDNAQDEAQNEFVFDDNDIEVN